MSAANVSLAAVGTAIAALISNCQGDGRPAADKPADCVVVTGAAAGQGTPANRAGLAPAVTVRCSAQPPIPAPPAVAGSDTSR